MAVLTYHRPDYLPHLLEDLQREVGLLEARSPHHARIVVVDNDPAASGAAAVTSSPAAGLVSYVVEPRRGIAAARNRALREGAVDDLLIFIDDDERPDPGWLTALVGTFTGCRCTAVAGPVRTAYTGVPDPWAQAGRFVDRSHRDGVTTGQAVGEAATNNLLVDLNFVRGVGLTFDETLGLAGGEDSLFTRQLVRAGGRIVWCAEAWVTDLRPGDRTTKRALLRRAFSFSNVSINVRLRLAEGPGARLRTRAAAVTAGLARMVVGSASLGLGYLSRRLAWRANGARLVARGLGAVAGGLGTRHEEYGTARAAGSRGGGPEASDVQC